MYSTEKRKRSWRIFRSSKSRKRSSSLSGSQSSLSSIGSQISNESTSAVESTLQELQRMVGNFKFPAIRVDSAQGFGEVRIALKQFEDRLGRMRYEMNHLNSSPVDPKTCEQEVVVLYDDTKLFLRDVREDGLRQSQPDTPSGQDHVEKLNDIQRRIHMWGRRFFPSAPIFVRLFEPQYSPPGPLSATLPPRTIYMVHFRNNRPGLYYTEGTQHSFKPGDTVVVEDILGDNVGTVQMEVDLLATRETMEEHIKGHLNALLRLSNMVTPTGLTRELFLRHEDLTKITGPVKRPAGTGDMASMSKQRRWEKTAKSELLQSKSQNQGFATFRTRFEVLSVEYQGSVIFPIGLRSWYQVAMEFSTTL